MELRSCLFPDTWKKTKRALVAGTLEVILKPDNVDELGLLIHDLLGHRTNNND